MSTDLSAVLAEERRIMNLYAPHYDVGMLTNGYVYRIERSRFVTWVASTVRAAGRQPGTLSVLDAGCGPGNIVALLMRAGFVQVTGVDLAEGMLAEAKKHDLAGVHWVRGFIEAPPFSSAAFDVIVASFTLHHLYDPGAFFRLVQRTLRCGGWFFVLDYDGAWDSPGVSRRARIIRACGNVVRAFFARKNFRALATRPDLPLLFNPAHRTLGIAEIVQAIPRPEAYEIRRERRGVLLPALLPVLVEESAFDRKLGSLLEATDRWLAPRTGGVFQWIAGRRRA
jgi:SAM-dependent methyltransferase